MTAELIGIIAAVGMLLPGLTALVQRSRWSTRTRTFAAVAVSILAGIVGYTATDGLSFESPSKIVYWIVGVILIAGSTYKTIWQPTGAADALQAATNRTSTPRRADATAPDDTGPDDTGPDTGTGYRPDA